MTFQFFLLTERDIIMIVIFYRIGLHFDTRKHALGQRLFTCIDGLSSGKNGESILEMCCRARMLWYDLYAVFFEIA